MKRTNSTDDPARVNADMQEKIRELEAKDPERANLLAELRKARAELAIILDIVYDLIVYRDLNLKTVWVSSCMVDWLGCSKDEIPGRVCYKARYQRTEPCPDCYVVRTMNTGEVSELESTSPDGTRWFIKCYPVRDEAGAIIGTVEICQDITKIKIVEANLEKSLAQTRKLIDGFIHAVASMVESRDPYTAGHHKRVASLARAIGIAMALPPATLECITTAALIHDIGKVSIPSEILNKTSTLSDVEHTIFKTHPQVAYNILKDVEFPWPLAEVVLAHHEHLDGSGYPNRLRGDAIPLEARIITVADVVEAMVSHRPYRPALSIDRALDEIVRYQGRYYDQRVVDVCVDLFHSHSFTLDE